MPSSGFQQDPTIYPRRDHPLMHFARAGVLTVLAPILATIPVAVAETPADLKAYCATTYGAGTEAGFDRRDNGPLCTERTSQGLGLLHHKVAPSAVCRAQHGTVRFRKEGPQIFCLADGEAPAADRRIDLAEHCRRTYGQSAIVSRRLTDNQPLCTVKGNGGLSQIHHAIDVGELCAGAPGSVNEKDVLDCSGAGTSAGGATAARKSGSPDPEKVPPVEGGSGQPSAGGEVPVTAIVAVADKPDLRGCGLPPSQEMVFLGYGEELAALGWGVVLPPSFYQQLPNGQTELAPGFSGETMTVGQWVNGYQPTPCPGLTGGFVPDLEEYCRSHNLPGTAQLLHWLPSGRPICHPPDYRPDLATAKTWWINIQAVCQFMYPDQSALRRGRKDDAGNNVFEGRLYPMTKLTGGKLECFYLDVSRDPIERYAIEFVTAEPPHAVLPEVKIGASFRVRLTFDTIPSRREEMITVSNARSGQSIEISAIQTENKMVFLTKKLIISEEIAP